MQHTTTLTHWLLKHDDNDLYHVLSYLELHCRRQQCISYEQQDSANPREEDAQCRGPVTQ